MAQTPRMGVSLLPSASQQVCGSPALDAMAEAFVRADEETRTYSEGLEDARGELVEEGMKGLSRVDDPDEEIVEEMSEAEETQKTVDDVTDVLDNLDDFLDRWDVDAELAKVRAENESKEKEMREKRETNSGFTTPTTGLDFGLMDAGVWD